jgi:dTDP-4-amino-4,6-dideoxygalactose transaminase
MRGEPDGPWAYQQIELGYNYRMTDLQAALGSSQLKRLDEFVRRRHVLASNYGKLLAELPLTLPHQDPHGHSAFHLYVVRLQLDKLGKSHRQIFDELRRAGIGVSLHYIPVSHQPYYQDLGFRPGDYPQAEKYYSEAISLPMYPGLSDNAQMQVMQALKDILQ